jgi:predicted NAD/FAD-binding protein
MKIAVIGGGVAGMAAAWNLQSRAEVSVFEADNRLGGHVDTHSLLVAGRTYSLDSAFTVFNPSSYPEFSRWLGELGVATQSAEASFSVRNLDTCLEYGSRGLNELPAEHVLRFMAAYQLRGSSQGQWRVISGGSQLYL